MELKVFYMIKLGIGQTKALSFALLIIPFRSLKNRHLLAVEYSIRASHLEALYMILR